MSVVLRIDHSGDLTNQYVQVFRIKLIFRSFHRDHPNHSILEAVDAKAEKASVTKLLTSSSVAYVTGAGHGNYEVFTGQSENPIWQATDDLSALKHKIVHLLACKTGALLGPSIIEAGAIAFWGYTVAFSFFHQKNSASLEQDRTAEAFLHMDIIIDRGILSGADPTRIYASIKKYVADVAPKLSALERGVLISNFVHLACPAINWGDRFATLR